MSEAAPRFVWYELMTTDTAAAAAFYGAVLGWTAAEMGQPGNPYTVFSAGTAGIGGMMALPEHVRAMGVPPCWTGYLAVPDVDDYAARVVAAGGKVTRPAEDIAQVGRFAVVADPQGAVFILFHGTGDMGPRPAAGTPGTVGWHELMAGDLDSAFAFYESLFGFTRAVAVDMGPMGIYQTFALAGGGDAVGGMMTKPPAVPVPCWQYYINVAGIDAAAGRVTQGGGKILNGPHQVPGGSWIAQCSDPQGAMFAMVSATR